MYERQFVGEKEIEQITEAELKRGLDGNYKSVELAIEVMKEYPGEWQVRTPFAYYRYKETT